MLNKMSGLSAKAYISLIGFWRGFKKDERGLEVVQVVLIILVGILLVSGLIYLLRDWLAELWAQITGADVTQGDAGGF